MSASKNPDSITSATGEFSSKVPPSEPLTTKGHAPGVKVGNDAKPEFNAETYPPGTAPKEDTFQPNVRDEIPSQAIDPRGENRTLASETILGATSADVHQGLGLPSEGMTSQEQHGGKRKHVSAGLEGVGASGSDPIHERGFDQDHEVGMRTDTENLPSATEQIPASAEEVASERPGGLQ